MRKSQVFFSYVALSLLILGALSVHAVYQQQANRELFEAKGRLVKTLELTDLCLFTEASYTRHLLRPTCIPLFRINRYRWIISLRGRSSSRRQASGGYMARWIERQKNILDFTLSALLRRKGKNAALALVYVLIVFLLASLMFFTYAIKQEAALILENAPEMVVQRSVAGRHDPIPVSYMEKLKEIIGVSSVKKRLWGYYYDSA